MPRELEILLIEDNAADAVLLEEYLRFQHVRIECVSCLGDGLRQAGSRRFDAILLDLGLPDSNGLETISRASGALPDMPIIVLTGLEDEDVATKAVARGAQDYLVKGQIDERSIVRTIRYAIDRKQTQEAIRRERDFVSTVLDTAGSLVVVLDREGRIVRFNRACEEATGYSFREVHGRRTWEFLLPAEAVASAKDGFPGFLSGDYPREVENCWVTRAGGRRLIAWYNTVLKNGNGVATSLISAGIDITEKRCAEEMLAEHMRNLEKLSAAATRLLEPMPYYELFRFTARELRKIAGQAVITVSEYSVSENRTIVQAISGPEIKMHAVSEILGRDPVGMSFAFDTVTRDRMIRGRLAVVEDGLYDLRCKQLPPPLCRALERELNLGEIFAMPFLFGNDFLGTVAILTDKDEGLKNRGTIEALVNQAGLALKRKRAEDALERAKEDLEQRVQERTADLSHAIDSLQTEVEARILAENALRDRSNQLRELASELILAEQRERRRMAKVLHDDLQQLLVGARFQLSPLQRSKDRTVQDAVSTVNELLSQSVEISRTLTSELSPPILYEGGLTPALEWLGRWMQDKHGLTVQLRSDHDENGGEPDDIKVLLFEAVRELLLNVVKYAGVNSAIVEVKSREDLLQITVRDEGRGFDPAELTRQGFSGGHGFFGIRERIESFGGSLVINSRPGFGSSLIMAVPVQMAAADHVERKISELGAGSGPEIQRSDDRKIRVLLADDHAVVRQGLTHLLSNEPDIEVVSEAADGEQAVDMARQFVPDVMLMDVNMPKMNGIEATKLIHSELPGIRVIGLSMFEEAERASQMRDAGAVAYVSKSGQSGEVIAAIRAAAFQNSPK
jgi:PAS domain S-box-containing protein